MNNYSKSEDGFWYKADKPAEDMSYKEYINWIKTNTNRSIGSGRKHGSAHGNKTHASYGIPWQSSLSTSGIGQKGILEGQVGVQIPFGKDKISFEWTPTEEVPMGNRIGFSTGEMPMDNLGWFTKLPNGRFKYNGEVLPYKKIEQPLKTGNGRYQFDSPTYQIYTGPKHEISEVINDNGSVNLKNLLNIQNEALQNVPGGTIARHRLENTKWHPTDWNTFLHTRDVYDRALSYNYPQEALFPTLMHDVGKMWAGDGHGPYGASIVQQIFPEASKKQIQAIYGHMDSNPIDPLTRLVKGVDIKEPNQFSTEWVLRDMPPMFRRNFNVTEDTLGDIVQLAPIKGSEFDNYKTFIYNKLGRQPEQSKLGIYPEYFFDRDVTGDFNPETGRARISANDDMPLSTAVHEDISHRSDDFVENELISNFIPETTIKQDVPTSVYYSDLANVTGNSKFREYTSEDWREMRATLNQLRFAAKKPLDDISNESIKSALNRVNGYGQDYANQLEQLDDFHKQQWFDKLRTAWKYLPAIIPIIRYEKEK